MRVNLSITLKAAEGALIRLLGTIERRGHRLLSLSSDALALGGGAQDVSIDVDCGKRSPDILVRQLQRLHDVLTVTCHRRPEADLQRHALSNLAGIVEPVRRVAHG